MLYEFKVGGEVQNGQAHGQCVERFHLPAEDWIGEGEGIYIYREREREREGQGVGGSSWSSVQFRFLTLSGLFMAHALSCLVLSCLVFVLSCPVFVLSCPVLSCLVSSRLVLSEMQPEGVQGEAQDEGQG